MVVEVSLRFELHTTNNQVEYQEVIVRITLVEEMRAECVNLRMNSLLLVSQIRGET